MLTILLLSVLVQNQVKGNQILPANADQHIYSAKAVEGMLTLSKDRQVTLWPSASEAKFYEAKQLPKPMLQEASGWLQRIVKTDDLPKATEDKWIGIRGPRNPDTLALRFGTMDSKQFQILEELHRFHVTVQDDRIALGKSEAENTAMIRTVISDTLRIPRELVSSATFHAGTVTAKNGTSFFVGSVEIDAEGKSVEWLSWSNRFWFIANDSTVSFTFTKSLGDGKPGMNKSSSGVAEESHRFGG